MKYLVFDITNVLYRTFFAHKQDGDITVAGLAAHAALTTINKYFKNFKPHKVVMCFDRSSWRKKYTATEECVSKKPYKGNRRQKMTPKEKEKFELFLEHIGDFETMVREHTSIISLAGDGLEADDLVAGFVRMHTINEGENEIIVVSGDKDMIQVLGPRGVRLIDPATGKDRTLDEWNGDVELFLFEKCVRGDMGDNVQSAFPKVRKTRIHKAYTDAFEKANLMHETWTQPVTGTEFIVKELFEENRILMDLRRQPENIQRLMIKTILAGTRNPGEYSYFHFLQFCGKYELKKIAQTAEIFTPMLSR